MQLCLCIIAKIFHPVGWMINELAYSLPYTHPFNSASVSRWCVCCAHVLAQMLAFDLEKCTCRVDDKLNGEQMIYERFKLSISWHEYLYRYYSNFLFAHFVRYTMIEPNSLSNKNTILTYLIYLNIFKDSKYIKKRRNISTVFRLFLSLFVIYFRNII